MPASLSRLVERTLRVALTFAIVSVVPDLALTQPARRVARPAPPGRMVDLGGYRLHLHCTGRGTPTVVLIHGFGDFSFNWSLVQTEVARETRVCSYDRAGQAWSDRGPSPRGLRRITDELHSLLGKSGEPGPYVLVGHSWGGLIPRLYVPEHRREGAGVVLVDASHEDMWMWLNGVTLQPRLAPDTLWDRLWVRKRAVAQEQTSVQNAAPDTGAVPPDTTAPTLHAPFDRLPKEAQRFQAWAQSLPPGLLGGDWNDVREDLRDVKRAGGAGSHAFRGIPVFVLSAGKDDFEDERQASAAVQRSQFILGQLELAKLSTNSRRVVASASGHRIQLEEPDVVVEAVRQVIESVRTGRKLCCH
jgi:pimeloyl-ACP methyl ester carboxylesterase